LLSPYCWAAPGSIANVLLTALAAFVGAETKLDVFERGTGQFPAWRVVMADRCRGRTGVEVLTGMERLQKCNLGVSLWTGACFQNAHQTSSKESLS
jgi:hypothetical protein